MFCVTAISPIQAAIPGRRNKRQCTAHMASSAATPTAPKLDADRKNLIMRIGGLGGGGRNRVDGGLAAERCLDRPGAMPENWSLAQGRRNSRQNCRRSPDEVSRASASAISTGMFITRMRT